MHFISADGQEIYINDSTLKKLLAHPGILDILPEAISKLIIGTENLRIKKEVNMGRIIGKAGLISTPHIKQHSKTYFVYRKERKFPSHVSKTEEGIDCQTIAISLYKDESTYQWMLITAFVGRNAPNEPFYYFDKESWFYNDEKQFRESLDFWMKHALVFEKDVMGEMYESTWEKEIEKIKNSFGMTR